MPVTERKNKINSADQTTSTSSSEKIEDKKDGTGTATKRPINSHNPSVSTKIPGFVLGKLAVFSVLAIALPILVFYYSLDRVGSTYAGVSAAITANFVLLMYIVVAWMEGEEDEGAEKKSN